MSIRLWGSSMSLMACVMVLICQCAARADCAKNTCVQIYAYGSGADPSCFQTCADMACESPASDCLQCGGSWCDAGDPNQTCGDQQTGYFFMACTDCTLDCPSQSVDDTQEVFCGGVTGTSGGAQVYSCKAKGG